jgi:AcrR family transcriptional regulator
MAPADDIPLKKQEIIDQAYQIFYDGGFHATGVDKVMADSGISKRTLYKYFPSKEQLIEAVLERYGATVESRLFEPAMARSHDPREQILALFDVRRADMDSHDYRGCLAMKAALEFKGKHAGIEDRGKASSQYIEGRFIDLCRNAGLADAEEVGRQVNLIFQGAILTSQARGDTEVFDAAKKAVRGLIGL